MTEPRHYLVETFGQMLREQLPNLFRLYLNPYVVPQTCLCLERYIQATWPGRAIGFRDRIRHFSPTALTRH